MATYNPGNILSLSRLNFQVHAPDLAKRTRHTSAPVGPDEGLAAGEWPVKAGHVQQCRHKLRTVPATRACLEIGHFDQNNKVPLKVNPVCRATLHANGRTSAFVFLRGAAGETEKGREETERKEREREIERAREREGKRERERERERERTKERKKERKKGRTEEITNTRE